MPFPILRIFLLFSILRTDQYFNKETYLKFSENKHSNDTSGIAHISLKTRVQTKSGKFLVVVDNSDDFEHCKNV